MSAFTMTVKKHQHLKKKKKRSILFVKQVLDYVERQQDEALCVSGCYRNNNVFEQER